MKVKRGGASSSSTGSTGGVFSGFSGFGAAGTSSSSSSSSNPFANVNLKASASTASSTSGTSVSGASAFGSSFTSNAIGNNTSATNDINGNTSTAIKTKEDQHDNERKLKEKMKKLNTNFLKFMEKNPNGIWKEGLQDYIKYATNLIEQFGVEASSDQKDGDTSESSSVKKPMQTFPSTSSSTTTSSLDPPKTNPAPFSFSANIPPPSLSTQPSKDPLPATSNPPFNFQAPSLTSSAPANTSIPPAAPFKFEIKPTADAATKPPPFSFGALPGNSLAPPTTTTGLFTLGGSGPKAPQAEAENDEGSGDEGEPILEPEKILKNEEDTDKILHEVPCKLFRYNTELKEWRDVGKGTLRITQELDGKQKQRILIRDPMGKITLNCYFLPGMKFDIMGKKKDGIRFIAAVGEKGDELMSMMVKLKPEDINSTLKKFNDGVASVS